MRMSRKRSIIANLDDLIAAFGGQTALGKLLHVSQGAISLWKFRGTIPPGWHIRLLIEADRKGLRLAPELFAIKGADAEAFARIFRAPTTAKRSRQPSSLSA